MKNKILIVGLFSIYLFIAACNKEEAIEQTEQKTIVGKVHLPAIVGTWELRHIAGMAQRNYAKGNGNIIVFTDSTYQRFMDGIMYNSGRYLLVKDTTASKTTGTGVPAGKFTHQIIFQNSLSSFSTFIEVDDKTLMLLSGYFPLDSGSLSTYEKQ